MFATNLQLLSIYYLVNSLIYLCRLSYKRRGGKSFLSRSKTSMIPCAHKKKEGCVRAAEKKVSPFLFPWNSPTWKGKTNFSVPKLEDDELLRKSNNPINTQHRCSYTNIIFHVLLSAPLVTFFCFSCGGKEEFEHDMNK